MESIYKNKWLGLFTLLLLFANVITLVLLWKNNKTEANNAKREVHAPPFMFIIKELGFTEDQQKLYTALRNEHQAQQRPLADSLRKAKNDFFDLLKDSSASDKVVADKSNRIMYFQQQLELSNFVHFRKLRAICTPDQQQHFDQVFHEILQRFASGRRPPNFPNEGPPPMRHGDRDDVPPPPDGNQER